MPGSVCPARRGCPEGPPSTRTTLQTEPDESVTLAALTTGAREVATLLARMLISQRRSTT